MGSKALTFMTMIGHEIQLSKPLLAGVIALTAISSITAIISIAG